VRDQEKARQVFGETLEILEGSALSKDAIRAAMEGCDAVHINLTQDAELSAMQHTIDSAQGTGLKRITYVSATTVREENRWFHVVDVKLRTEEILCGGGIPWVVFCPTWVMETLNNFIHGAKATIITGRNPPALHFFAAQDFGRMVAASYADDRALGNRLFVHGPEAISLPEALSRFYRACHPELKVMSLKLWQAQLIAKLTGREGLKYVTSLIDYFDKVGELGDPGQADALFGPPSITLDEWFTMPRDDERGLPH
jgi:uncharacterized protein YbjT (DUF2867 family)